MTRRAESDPELQRLARKIVLVIEPILLAASALGIGAEGAEPGKCHNDWCPLCAAASMARGEQHPVVDTLVAAGTTLVAVMRAAAHSGADDSTNDGSLTPDQPSPQTTSGYQHIPVTLVD